MGDVGVVEIDDWEDVWMMMIISMMIIIIIIIIIHLFIVHLMVVLGFLRARKSSFEIRECSRSRRRRKRPSTF